LHFTIGTIVVTFAAIVIADRAGAFGYRGDDYAQFDRIGVTASTIANGDTFIVSGVGEVHLLGVDASAAHWSDQANKYLEARLKDRTVTLKLDGTQTRDERHRLQAYVYVTDNDCLNVDIVRDGQAFADRRFKHTLKSTMEQSENDARKKKRGMWRAMTDERQPAWRQQWLRSRRPKAGG
jgi:endonuclease YncB( thermonuclease family)